MDRLPRALRNSAIATGLALAALALPIPLLHGVAHAADPAPSESATASAPDVSAGADPTPAPSLAPTAPPDPTPSPAPTSSPPPDPTASPSPSPTVSPTPSPTGSPTPAPDPTPGPSPSPAPSPTPTPPPAPPVPTSLNLYVSAGFRYQDPNYTACTATAAEDMLNFIAFADSGGTGFRWTVTRSGVKRDAMLSYARAHDTLAIGERGSDPHGWRNALNYYGWGSRALAAGSMVYADRAYTSYAAAVRTAVRQMILTRKPVGLLGWAGQHAQILTGYYGLKGNPLARNADGTWSSAFSVAGLYVTDPLRSDRILNKRVSYTYLASAANLHLRFRKYTQRDSPYDDRYTSGFRASWREWYGKYTLLIPLH
jgi:hypothetical protein